MFIDRARELARGRRHATTGFGRRAAPRHTPFRNPPAFEIYRVAVTPESGQSVPVERDIGGGTVRHVESGTNVTPGRDMRSAQPDVCGDRVGRSRLLDGSLSRTEGGR